MPVYLSGRVSNQRNHLIPAPFVSISKNYDKDGTGEILGVSYSIQLTGTMVADRGSPKANGVFIQGAGVDVYYGFTANEYHQALLNKGKALMNMFSKVYDGQLLTIDSPMFGNPQGISCYVTVESVDLPGHAEGDPYKMPYTINLSTNALFGPNDVPFDSDDYELAENWMIRTATETWGIEEVDKQIYTRHGIDGGVALDDAGAARGVGFKGELVNSKKLFQLTRNMSATGKNKFLRTSKSEGVSADDNWSTVYAPNGRAWQQARGYLYDKIKYGNHYLFGKDDTEFVAGLPDGGVANVTDKDADDVHLFSMNFPTPNTEPDPLKQYVAFNYKRLSSVDINSGSFNVTETWYLAPSAAKAMETMDFSITEESEGDGSITISVNGTIEGLGDNADTINVAQAGNQDRAVKRDAIEGDRVFDYLGAGGFVKNSKWQNAIEHYEKVMPTLYKTVVEMLNDLPEYVTFNVNPVPESKSVTEQPGTGTITYNISFTTKDGANGKYIPYCRTEDWTVNDTYPGMVIAQHTVLGRRVGPVLQSINTQTQWQRDFSITANFDVNRGMLCVDAADQIQNVGDQAKCLATVDSFGSLMKWIQNPNFVDARSFLMFDDYSTDFINAKPGAANPTVNLGVCNPEADPATSLTITSEAECDALTPAGSWNPNGNPIGHHSGTSLIQSQAIKKLIDSFDPKTYLITGPNNPKRVHKRFVNPPQESWNPKTGDWSFSVSWIYEINDPYAFPSGDYVFADVDGTYGTCSDAAIATKAACVAAGGTWASAQDDGQGEPYPGQEF
jgi:hypothetical protein